MSQLALPIGLDVLDPPVEADAAMLPAPAELHWLTGIVGDAAAFRLIEAYGGTRCKVPSTRLIGTEVAALLGREAAGRLVDEFAGQIIKMPLAKRWRAHVYYARGHSVREIARALGTTEAVVHKHLRGTSLPRRGSAR